MIQMIAEKEKTMLNTTKCLANKLTDVNVKLEALLVAAKKSSQVNTCQECENVEKYSSNFSEVPGRSYQARLRATLIGVAMIPSKERTASPCGS